MVSGIEWFLVISVAIAVVVATFLAAVWLEAQRFSDVRTLSMLGESLGMCYRVLGRDHLFRSEPFVLHERPGSAAENSVIERSLVSTRPQGLPAIFEYVSYQDPMGLRRLGTPFLVLAARVPAGTPGFMLRPRGPLERVGSLFRHHGASQPRTPPGWMLRVDEPEKDRPAWPGFGMDRLTASRLWIQANGRKVYVAQAFRPRPGCGFTPRGVERLVRLALLVLKALNSPDVRPLAKCSPGCIVARCNRGVNAVDEQEGQQADMRFYGFSVPSCASTEWRENAGSVRLR